MVVAYWPVIVGIVVVVVAVRWGVKAADRDAERVEAERRRAGRVGDAPCCLALVWGGTRIGSSGL
jgi:hypothetical protein